MTTWSPSHERLTALVDEADVRALLVSFGRYLDERRWGDYASLYADDAVLELPQLAPH